MTEKVLLLLWEMFLELTEIYWIFFACFGILVLALHMIEDIEDHKN
jgi:hypothetical protein